MAVTPEIIVSVEIIDSRNYGIHRPIYAGVATAGNYTRFSGEMVEQISKNLFMRNNPSVRTDPSLENIYYAAQHTDKDHEKGSQKRQSQRLFRCCEISEIKKEDGLPDADAVHRGSRPHDQEYWYEKEEKTEGYFH